VRNKGKGLLGKRGSREARRSYARNGCPEKYRTKAATDMLARAGMIVGGSGRAKVSGSDGNPAKDSPSRGTCVLVRAIRDEAGAFGAEDVRRAPNRSVSGERAKRSEVRCTQG